MREWLALLLVCLATVAQAKGPGNIVAFDADEIEVRQGDKYDFVDPKTLGKLPIPIEKRDKRNFLLIKAPGDRMLWVNGGDVQTDAVTDLRHNCSSLAMSQSPDRSQYGMRGVGERCK
jgi:hypothetical protein